MLLSKLAITLDPKTLKNIATTQIKDLDPQLSFRIENLTHYFILFSAHDYNLFYRNYESDARHYLRGILGHHVFGWYPGKFDSPLHSVKSGPRRPVLRYIWFTYFKRKLKTLRSWGKSILGTVALSAHTCTYGENETTNFPTRGSNFIYVPDGTRTAAACIGGEHIPLGPRSAHLAQLVTIMSIRSGKIVNE